jgi:hypothetical protein
MLELILVLNATLPDERPLALVVGPAVVAHPEKAKTGKRKSKAKANSLSFKTLQCI